MSKLFFDRFYEHMFKPNIQHLAFDDRLLTLLGIPLMALIIPFVFFGVDWQTYRQVSHQEYPESLIYTSVFWFSNRYLIIALRKRFNAFSDTFKRIALHLAILLIMAPLFSTGITIFLRLAVYDLFGLKDLVEPSFFQGLSSTYVITFAVMMFYETIYFFHKYKEAILEKDRIQMAHVQGQLDNLRNQINPHFLFNSLNTLMNLIPTDPNRAMSYLDKLSRFYRYAVSNHEQHLSPLRTELENVHLFADLLKERFHEGIRFSLPEETTVNAQILPLSLQLLIENAVKHNIVSRKKPLHIEVEITEDGQAVLVKNNMQKRIRAVSSTGMGLKNIRTRLAFFTQEPLVVEEDDHCFRVAIPLIFSSQEV